METETSEAGGGPSQVIRVDRGEFNECRGSSKTDEQGWGEGWWNEWVGVFVREWAWACGCGWVCREGGIELSARDTRRRRTQRGGQRVIELGVLPGLDPCAF